MDPQQAVGFASFLAQTDAVGKAHRSSSCCVMSVATWYLIVTKALTVLPRAAHAARASSRAFWNAPSLAAVRAAPRGAPSPTSRSRTSPGTRIVASRHHQRHGADKLAEAGIERRIPHARHAPRHRRGHGAPRVGAHGARLGRLDRALRRPVRHGLGRLPRAGQRSACRGQGTLDKVAGPGRRGADHDRARPRGRDSRGARLQRASCAPTAWCSRGWTRSRTTSSRCSPPARTSTNPAPVVPLKPRRGGRKGA